tara:strand:- start:131 stop:523 length:393 start_codon:yes stop_codon:yes gene_type:complete
MGLSKCFKALAEIDDKYVMDVSVKSLFGFDCIGFNANSGYVYIALEDGITICSMLGRDVEYLVTDYNDGEEFFFDTYKEAEAKLQEMSNEEEEEEEEKEEAAPEKFETVLLEGAELEAYIATRFNNEATA